MEKPPKPQIEHEYRKGSAGEIIEQMTPESEIAWAKYLTELLAYRRSAILEDNGTEEKNNKESS